MTNLFSDASSDADRPAKEGPAGWVLVVDDDDDNRDATVDLLNDAGYDARGVSGGTDALAALRGERPCLVLVDLIMRDMDGRELLLEARRRLEAPLPPFVFVTGAGPSKLEDISGLILTKPVDVDRLLGVVALHCSG
jgi:CheY-like chemotaxis protein